MKIHLLGAAIALVTLGACRNADSAPVPGSEPALPATPATPDARPVGSLAAFSLYDIGTSWRNERGDSLLLAEMAGTVRVVALVYTSCHGTCPLIVNDMKRIEAAIPPGRDADVGFVLISLDPARDTPGRLAAWAADNELDPARWTMLNGTDVTVREIAATLGVRYQVQPDGEVAHSNIITVLDRDGMVVHQQTTLGDETLATSAIVNRLLAP